MKTEHKELKATLDSANAENLEWFVKYHEARGVKFPKTEYLTNRDIIELVCQRVIWQPYIPLISINANGEFEECESSIKHGIEEMNKRTEWYKKEIKRLEKACQK